MGAILPQSAALRYARSVLAPTILALALLQAAGAGDSTKGLVDQLGATSLEALIASFPAPYDPADDRLLERLEDELLAAGELEAAEAVCRERLRGRTERFGEGHRNTHPVLSNLSWILFRQGRFEAARDGYEQLLELSVAVSGEDSLEAIVTRVNLASVYQGLGDYADVESSYKEALEAIRTTYGAESVQVLTVQNNLASFLQETGRLTEAEAYARGALELTRKLYGDTSIDCARALLLLAQVHEAQWRLDDAEAGYRESKALMEAALDGEDERLGNAWRYLASALFSKGDYQGAEACWTEALRHFRATVGEEHFNTIAVHNGLGLAAQYSGRLERATDSLEHALALTDKLFGPEHPARVHRALNLAHVFIERGLHGRAEALARSTLEALEGQTGPPSPPHRVGRCAAQGRLAQALHGLGRDEEALELAEASIAGYVELFGPDYRQTLGMRVLEATILESLGRSADARASAEAALRVAELMRPQVLGDELTRARFADNLGLASITSMLTRLSILGGDPARALELAERGRGRFLLDLLSRTEHGLLADRPEQRARYDALVLAEERARFQLRQAEQRTASAQAADREEVIAAVRRLQSASAAIAEHLEQSLVDSRPMTAEAIRAQLPEGELLLSFHWSRELVALVTVPPAGADSVRAFTIAEGAAAVEALANRTRAFAAELATDPRRRGPFEPARLAELADALLPTGARERLATAQRVVAITEGPLRGVPVELLLASTPSGSPEVVHSPSASVYLNRLALAKASGPSEPGSADTPGLLAIADPTFAAGVAAADGVERDSRPTAVPAWYGGELAPLPATRVEAARAVALFEQAGRPTVLLAGAEATRTAVEASSPRAAYLHFATHGVHGQTLRPLDAGLALSSGAQIPVEESFLTLDRLLRSWSGRLDRCELVVLSACDTHREFESGADTLSLPWGFFHAGAPTVIATLWKVDDRAAALVIARFYENLLGARDGARPMTKIAALTEARSWLAQASRSEVRAAWSAFDRDGASAGARGGTDAPMPLDTDTLRPYADPYFWASFVLLGAPD